MLFEKFGEMDSYDQINMAAEGLLNEGDLESLKTLAEENGIPEDIVELYRNGEVPELCDPMTAAFGKLEKECKELKPEQIMEDWVEYVRGQCMEHDEMAVAVRRKGKSLKGCIAEILKWSFKNAKSVDREILKASGVSASRVTLGIPGMGQVKKIIKAYYMGEK